VGVPLLRRNIKPVKDFQRLFDISLLHNAFSKLLCAASEHMLCGISAVGELIQPVADGGLITANCLSDFDLGLAGFGEFEDEADFRAAQPTVVTYGLCRLLGEAVGDGFRFGEGSLMHSGSASSCPLARFAVAREVLEGIKRFLRLCCQEDLLLIVRRRTSGGVAALASEALHGSEVFESAVPTFGVWKRTAEAVGVELARPPAMLAGVAFMASQDFFAVQGRVGVEDAVVVGKAIGALQASSPFHPWARPQRAAFLWLRAYARLVTRDCSSRSLRFLHPNGPDGSNASPTSRWHWNLRHT
jgi:hypothetical protein